MEIPQILEQLERSAGWFPRTAVEAAVAKREELTPALLAILEKTIANAEEIAGGEEYGDYMAHLYALLLLAQFREVRALPLVLQFAALPEDVLEGLCGDFVGDDLARVIASVCGGETAEIEKLIVDAEHADPAGRAAALDSLLILVAVGKKTRDEVAAYFGSLYKGALERKPSFVWDALVSASLDLHAAEHAADIEQAYSDGLADPEFLALKDVKEELAHATGDPLEAMAENPYFTMVNDVVKEMNGWACFRDKRAGAEKVGRNDACPCGSGKKYKKCCLV